MDDAPNNPKTTDRAWLAREVNKHILELSERLHDERPIGFFCECGCMGIVSSTQADYEQSDGVWLDGHQARDTSS
jgi:hypothetical protein